MLTKLEQFLNDLVSHVFKNSETDIIYVNPLENVPKKKRDGRIVPDKFQGLTKYSYRKAAVGLTWEDILKLAKMLEGSTPQVDIDDCKWSPLGNNNCAYEHASTLNKAIRAYYHSGFPFNTESKSAYITADGRVLTKEEVDELYTYISVKESNKHDLKNPPTCRNMIVDKVKFFKNGDLVYNDLDTNILKTLGLDEKK